MTSRRGALRRTLLVVPMFVLGAAGVAIASPTSVKSPHIDFEREPLGAVPNGFTTADNTIAHFSDSLGSNLSVLSNNPETIGQGLAETQADASAIVIDFDVPVSGLAFAFGNDDPNDTEAGDVAILNLYRGGDLVDAASIVLNRNDAADQTIGVSGTTFRRAEFYYARAGVAIDASETVDNVQIWPRCVTSGTSRRDRLVGDSESNSLCGFAGNDRILARGDIDFVQGGDGRDLIRGGSGRDTLMGGRGGDTLRADDGANDDTVYGGRGIDVCYVDAGDHTRGCNEVLVAPAR